VTILGHVFLLLFFLAQYVEVVIKPTRRVLKGDEYILNADIRILWMAVSAICIGVQSVGLLL
jgi:hypothetical protein